jgi:hypothetical protein
MTFRNIDKLLEYIGVREREERIFVNCVIE